MNPKKYLHTPNIEFSATSNKTINLTTLHGKNIVIYFYPKDNTPGCTTEGQNFRDSFDDFTEINTVILGVSRDSIKTHENFKNKHSFGFELISDTDEILCNLFDVIKQKKLYGREYLGIERSTFLFDIQGELVKEWRKVKIKNHVDEVLNFIQQL